MLAPYPRKIRFLAFGSSLFLWSFRTCTVHVHVSRATEYTEMVDVKLLPIPSLQWVMSLRALVGLRFTRYAAVDKASAQNLWSSLVCMHWPHSFHTSPIYTCMHSDTPFCSGVFGIVYWCSIPFLVMKSSRLVDVEVVTKSSLSIWSFLLVSLMISQQGFSILQTSETPHACAWL